mgnify:CR=1 FL=1
MSKFQGLEGMDLSGVEISRNKMLPVGRHIVKITDAKVERDNKKDTAQLVLSYAGEDGATIRQWIWVYHSKSPEATEIGKKQLKELLLILGNDGSEAPSVSFFQGKTVGIFIKSEVYLDKTTLKVSYHFEPPVAKDGGTDAPSTAPLDDEIPF